MVTRSRSAAPALEACTLIELRAALEAGASPGAALASAAASSSLLAGVAREVRLGRPIAEIAAEAATGDPSADLLLRALGVAEQAGAGALDAVEQAARAAREDERVRLLLRVKTAQARGTARVLVAVPLVMWLVLVGLDPRALRFYTTTSGVLTAVAAIALVWAGAAWSRRIVSRAAEAAAAADPLVPAAGERDPVRAAVLAVPAVVVLGFGVHPLVGLAAGAVAATIGYRPRPEPGVGPAARSADGTGGASAAGSGGAAEAVELVAVGLAAGLPAAGAVAVVAPLAPAAARPPLAAAARRLRDGWSPAAAFEGGGLAEAGALLDATGRWGAPAEPALRRLAADLRARRRAAAEEAAERAQLALVFPTTLLTLPAFGLAVVPPLVWAALTDGVWSA